MGRRVRPNEWRFILLAWNKRSRATTDDEGRFAGGLYCAMPSPSWKELVRVFAARKCVVIQSIDGNVFGYPLPDGPWLCLCGATSSAYRST